MKVKYSLVLLSCLTSVAWGDYQYESYLSIGQDDSDGKRYSEIYSVSPTPVIMPSTSNSRSSGESDGYNIGFTYYFSPVDTSRLPLKEAGYFSKSSIVSASYSKAKSTSENQSFIETGERVGYGRARGDSSNINISSEYKIDSLPFYVGLNVGRGNGSSKVVSESLAFVSPGIGIIPTEPPIVVTEMNQDAKNESYGGRLGYYVGSNGRAFYQYSRYKSEIDILDGSLRNESKSHQINYRHVLPLFSSQFVSVQLAAAKSKSDQSETDSKAVGIQYYPNTKLSFGYSYSLSDHPQSGDISSNILSADYFFSDALSVGINAQKSNNEFRSRAMFFDEIVSITDNETDEESISLSLGYRF